MDVLKVEEILGLSIFQCKMCGNRLRPPIMQLLGIRNVCGCCYEGSGAAIAFRNKELEAVLAKLQLPCNYAKNGCTLEGLLIDICEHEATLCLFRERNCPLEVRGWCENNFSSVDQLNRHIKQRHADNVVDLRCVSSESVKNPNKSKINAFYLLITSRMDIVLRARFDETGRQILYEFYCVTCNVETTNVKVSIVLQSCDSILNLSNIRVRRLRHGEFPYMLDVNQACKISLAVLEHLGCLENIAIKVEIDGSEINDKKQIAKATNDAKLWFECNKCSEFFREITLRVNDKKSGPPAVANGVPTSSTNEQYAVVQQCTKCANANDLGHSSRHISLPNTIVGKPAFTCKNLGCGKQIKPDDYELHYNFLCRFRKYYCIFVAAGNMKCEWSGLAADAVHHLRTRHRHVLSVQEVTMVTNERKKRYFLKENDVFAQEYTLSVSSKLIVTTHTFLEMDVRNKYVWQIFFEHPLTGCRTIISSNYTHYGCKRIIDVNDYLVENSFTFQVVFKHAANLVARIVSSITPTLTEDVIE